MVITGIIKELDTIETLKGNSMAMATLIRNSKKYPLIIFPSVWKEYNSIIQNGAYISVEVKPDKHSGNVAYIVQSVVK